VRIPVMAKMTPEANTAVVAEACFQGGAAAVSAINCPQSLPGVDIYQGGRPLYPNTRNQSFAGLCGAWIRPLAYRHVAQIRMRCPDLPILGGGGLATWRHVVEMFMWGATAVSFCTVLMLKGFEVLRSIEEGLIRFMEQQGYENVAQMRGLALKYLVTPMDVYYLDMIPQIDYEKCSGCKVCTQMGHCDVIVMDEDKPRVAYPERCFGCGVCYFICPRAAISMVAATNPARS
jgi:NAD-dependent dihydropyrimidine dehydrogenase PreA subunit